MKKFLILLVVVALTCLGSMAFAADISVSGSIETRSRAFNNLTDLNDDANDNDAYTQTRIRLNVDAKAGDHVKGRITIENDWDTWGAKETTGAANGRVENPMGNGKGGGNAGFMDLREAWLDFMVPGLPVGIKGGHQLLQLGQGWFFRSQKYGSDAWLVYAPMGANTLAFVDVKALEGSYSTSDDTDAYVILDSYKMNENNTVGIDLTVIRDRDGVYLGTGGAPVSLNNLGLNYTGKVGPVNLKAQVDIQNGEIDFASITPGETNPKFKGNQLVVQGSVPLGPLTVNATLAMGSGQDESADVTAMQTILDKDRHYTLIYEYLLATAAGSALTGAHSMKNTGFANTTAVSVGAGYKVSDSVNVGLDLWMLQATEDVALNGGTPDSGLGTEIDASINWKLYDNLSWNWALGYFMPGDAYKGAEDPDAVTAIQGVLAMKF